MSKKIFDLRCRGEEFPQNVTDDVYFTWRLRNCMLQKKAVVTVYEGEKVVYSAEKEGAQTILYAKKFPMKSLALYRYEIEVYTELFCERAEGCFRAGLLEGFDRRAKWISAGVHFVADNEEAGSPAQYYKRNFTLQRAPKNAVVNLCGLGLYELSINGRRVGDRVLEPAFTEYDKRVLYSTYDVSGYLRAGENEVEVVVGDGWYNQTTQDTWGFYRAPWRDNAKLLFQLNFEEGALFSDESWQVSVGEITYNALRAGEICNFTAERNYYPARLTTPPGGVMVPSYLPPIRECEVLSPVCVSEGKDCTIYDFGKNITGYIGATFQGERGQEVEIVYSDRIREGACDNASNGMYLFNKGLKYQTDGCVLSGGEDFFKPKFVYHGFRYVTVGKGVQTSNLQAYFVHTDLKRTGNFTCSDEKLQALENMAVNSILSNYHGFPTDCPHREKNGWTGDAQLSMETSVYHFDMQEAYRKWLDDFIVNQRPCGQISAIVPTCGWGYNWGSGPAWDIALFRISEAMLNFYGDVQYARKIYPYLKKYHAYISQYVTDGLLTVGLGDWNYPRQIEFAVCPTELTDSGYYKLMSEILSRFAERLEPALAEGYRQAAEESKRALAKKYKEEKSLTGLAALTYFGVFDYGQKVCAYLSANGCAPHAGILGVKYVVSVLTARGESELLYEFLARTEYPSFGYWAEHGQTSLCEDFELTNSLNHHMYSCITEAMYSCFCGIKQVSPRKCVLSPSLPKKLNKASAEFNGFTVEVERQGEDVVLSFTVPSNGYAFYKEEKFFEGDYRFTI